MQPTQLNGIGDTGKSDPNTNFAVISGDFSSRRNDQIRVMTPNALMSP